MPHASRGNRFRYVGWDWQGATLSCTYDLDGTTFTERFTFDDGAEDVATSEAADAAARLVFLLAGISYYKASAPPVIDLGEHALTERERGFLRTYYVKGLGEFAYKNGLLRELQDVAVHAPVREPARVAPPTGTASRGPLVPFGGGIDSIVVVEETRQRDDDLALFVVSRANARFEAIEAPAKVTGLPVVRVDRQIDPQILRSRELGYLNGHVPVTGILSALAVLAAVRTGRRQVIMSNEWSASSDTLESDGIAVNHQWSKSAEFETRFRQVLAATLPGFDYHSALRARSELWVAERFAALTKYHDTFRSCNRAFHLDPAQRAETWCGRCDKCCFIDLVLAPFMTRAELEKVFSDKEPLAQPDLEPVFRSLLGDPELHKPFECVGDVQECRVAAVVAAERPDRQGDELLQRLAAESRARTDLPPLEQLLQPLSESYAPAEHAAPALG